MLSCEQLLCWWPSADMIAQQFPKGAFNSLVPDDTNEDTCAGGSIWFCHSPYGSDSEDASQQDCIRAVDRSSSVMPTHQGTDTPTHAYLQARAEATAGAESASHNKTKGNADNLGHLSTSCNSIAPFAELQWQHMHSEISVKADTMDSIKLWLQCVSLQQSSLSQTGDTAAFTQPAQQKQDIVKLDAAYDIEHTALMDPQGQPLACHVQVKSQHGSTTQHQVSVNCGAITMCHIPGFLTDCVTYATHATAADDVHKTAHTSANSSSPTQPDHPTNLQQDLVAPRHANNVSLSLSVLAIGAGALSACTSNPHAVWVNCSRLSCHLGSIRARGRAGSLVAGLFALQQGPQPEHGLRMSAAGIQLGTVQDWQGGIDIKTLKPAGMQAISSSFELQVLLQGWPLLQAPEKPHQAQQPAAATAAGQVAWPTAPVWQAKSSPHEHTSVKAAPDSEADVNSQLAPLAGQDNLEKLMTLAVSTIDLNLSGLQIAILAAVAGAVTAESSRSFRQPLPQQGISPDSLSDQGKAGWLACISLHTAAAHVLYAPDDTLPAVLAQPPKALQKLFSQRAEVALAGTTHASEDQLQPAPAVPKWVLLCDQLTIILAVGPMTTHLPGMSLALAMPHAWGSPDLTVQLPACDISIGRASAQQAPQTHTLPNHPQAEVGLQPEATPEQMLHMSTSQRMGLSWQCIGTPIAIISNTSITVESVSSCSTDSVNISLSSISLDLGMPQLSTAVQLIALPALGPALPVLATYPPHTKPLDCSIHVYMSIQLLFGQLSIDEPAISADGRAPVSDLAFWMVDAVIKFDKKLVQVCCHSYLLLM